ncbi:MAG: TerB family tellurite resistance protein [Gammaproteobacteria bacterium]|nr:TerB family tellurite resistance protein [Gammaproteobacteria bacterium]
MIKRLFEQVMQTLSEGESADSSRGDREAALRMATAVLMIDVALADNLFDEAELDRVLDLIEANFGLTPQEAAELTNAATEKAEELVSLHEFTQLLHQNLSEAEKARIVGLLWQIAYADGELDKFEDALVLKISDLLYVSRGRVMRLKHDAGVAANVPEA